MPTTKKKPRAGKKPITEKTRASDEELRESLRHADMGKFAKGLAKAIRPAKVR
jgi:hypothetical protein